MEKNNSKNKMQHGSNEMAVITSDLSDDIQNVFAHAFQLHQQGNLQEAADLYQVILGVDPDHADSLHLLGLIVELNNDLETACDLIKHAIQVNPRIAQFHYNLARIYQAMSKLDMAIKQYKKAVRLKPDYGEAYENLGVASQDFGDYQAAAQAYVKAIKLNPQSQIALLNMGTLQNQSGRPDDAISYLDRVLSCNPVHAEAHSKRAQIQLAKGNFLPGWKESQWTYIAQIFIDNNPVRLIPFPKWDGSSLLGKRLLINADQGIGDELMYASCLQDVIEQAAYVAIECDPRLVAIYQRSFPGVMIIPGDKAGDFYWTREMKGIDFRISMSELPRFYRHNEDDFPKRNCYLKVDPVLMESWQNKLQQLEGNVNIGISWHGGVDKRASEARSIPLKFWKNIFQLENINFINLQYGDHADEIETFHQQGNGLLHCFEGLDPLTDIDGFCALIKVLDLVISIDNSTVHLGGAVGTPVWALLPFFSDWRWLHDRKDSVWYPSVKLYRSGKTGLDARRKLLAVVEKDLTESLLADDIADTSENTEACDSNTLSNQLTGQLISRVNKKAYALLLNDTTSWYHWGCTCTSLAIHDRLRARWDSVVSVPIYNTNHLDLVPTTIEHFDDNEFFEQFCNVYPWIIEKIRDAGEVYINGEGTLHGVSQTTLGLLYLAYIAKTRMNRRISIINHSCYPDDNNVAIDSQAQTIFRKVYEQLDNIAVREVVSAKLLTSMGLTVTQSFDCLPLYIEQYYQADTRTEKGRIVIAGSVSWGVKTIRQIGDLIEMLHKNGFSISLLIGANAYPAGDDMRLVQALHRHVGTFCELVYAWSEQEWLSTIDHAALVISGRFHHTIAAAFLNTPFIVMESNTKKIEGLLTMLDIDTFVATDQARLSEVLYDNAMQLLKDPARGLLDKDIRERLLGLAISNC